MHGGGGIAGVPKEEEKGVGRGNEGMAPMLCLWLSAVPLAEALIKSRINPRIALPAWESPRCCPCPPFWSCCPPVFQQPFPKKFPFSEFVPKVYSQIKEFIYACLKFSEDLHLRWGTCPQRAQLNSNMEPGQAGSGSGAVGFGLDTSAPAGGDPRMVWVGRNFGGRLQT